MGLLAIPSAALAQSSLPPNSLGSAGVNATILHQPPYNLTGRKIAIGQVELGRPALFGFDKVADRNRNLRPWRLFFQDRPAQGGGLGAELGNREVDAHAHKVAGVMVSRDKEWPGVAPGARLYSTGIGPLQSNGQPEECRAANHLALQNGGDVRAINFSFGESLERDPRPNAQLDGNALLTRCVDWSARVHDVVYVVAGNQGAGGIPIPTDNYNGINVAFSTRWQGAFQKLDFANVGGELASVADRQVGRERSLDQRRSIDLVAPGSQLALLSPEGEEVISSGTSFAAPHVTAAVAVIQEYGDRQLAAGTPDWTIAARRHEVTKAVLLNSADKVQDPGNGHFLAMTRTLLNHRSNTWLDSPAYRQARFPLDRTLGAGHLNVFRAYQQFSAGPGSPLGPVQPQGWDYNSVGNSVGLVATDRAARDSAAADRAAVDRAAADPASMPPGALDAPPYRDYVLAQPLQAGNHVAITLVWDRWVDLDDRNGNGEYDEGESFRDLGLNNLDLFLLPLEAQTTGAAVAASTSPVDSTEHLFAAVPQSGRYKIRVQYQDQAHQPTQAYGLAWWTQPLPQGSR